MRVQKLIICFVLVCILEFLRVWLNDGVFISAHEAMFLAFIAAWATEGG